MHWTHVGERVQTNRFVYWRFPGCSFEHLQTAGELENEWLVHWNNWDSSPPASGPIHNVSNEPKLAKSVITARLLWSSLITSNFKLNYDKKPWNIKKHIQLHACRSRATAIKNSNEMSELLLNCTNASLKYMLAIKGIDCWSRSRCRSTRITHVRYSSCKTDTGLVRNKGLIVSTGVGWCEHVIMMYWLGTYIIQHKGDAWCLLSRLRRGSAAGIMVQQCSSEGDCSPSQNRRMLFSLSLYYYFIQASRWLFIEKLASIQGNYSMGKCLLWKNQTSFILESYFTFMEKFQTQFYNLCRVRIVLSISHIPDISMHAQYKGCCSSPH